MKKNPLYYSMAGGVLLLIFLLFGYWISHHNLSFTCSSSTASFASNINNTMSLNFTQSMTFSYRGKAVVYLSGNITTSEAKYELNRTIVYSYTRTGTSDYSLQVVNATSAGSDTVPEYLEQTYLGSLLQKAQRIIGIRKMPSGDMLIANNAGPYLICAVH